MQLDCNYKFNCKVMTIKKSVNAIYCNLPILLFVTFFSAQFVSYIYNIIILKSMKVLIFINFHLYSTTALEKENPNTWYLN